MFDNLINNLSNAIFFSILEDLETFVFQRFNYNKANQVNYKKFFPKKKAVTIKTNFFVLFNFLYF